MPNRDGGAHSFDGQEGGMWSFMTTSELLGHASSAAAFSRTVTKAESQTGALGKVTFSGYLKRSPFRKNFMSNIFSALVSPLLMANDIE